MVGLVHVWPVYVRGDCDYFLPRVGTFDHTPNYCFSKWSLFLDTLFGSENMDVFLKPWQRLVGASGVSAGHWSALTLTVLLTRLTSIQLHKIIKSSEENRLHVSMFVCLCVEASQAAFRTVIYALKAELAASDAAQHPTSCCRLPLLTPRKIHASSKAQDYLQHFMRPKEKS